MAESDTANTSSPVPPEFLAELSSILEDFESCALALEQSPSNPDLHDRMLRAVHTIRGNASCLQITPLVDLSTAIESALANVFAETQRIDGMFIDVLLASADALARDLAAMTSGAECPQPSDLISRLANYAPRIDVAAATAKNALPREQARAKPLDLPASKQPLIEFISRDLDESLHDLKNVLAGSGAVSTREVTIARAIEIADIIHTHALFFQHPTLLALSAAVKSAVSDAPTLSARAMTALHARVLDAVRVLTTCANDLKAGLVVEHPVDELIASLTSIDARPDTQSPDADVSENAHTSGSGGLHRSVGRASGAVRLAERDLDAMLALAAELARRTAELANQNPCASPSEIAAAGAIDRISTDLQSAILRAGTAPVAPMLAAFRRPVRDLARATGKSIALHIDACDVALDRSALVCASSVLIHLLRNSAAHGIESPEDRAHTGKPAAGTITLAARHEGSTTVITVHDDGRGLSRESIVQRAASLTLASQTELEAMSDEQIYRLTLHSGFSTAGSVTDLAGRGLGLPSAARAIESIGGTLDITSSPNQGTTVTLRLPAATATLPVRFIEVAGNTYALPESAVSEVLMPASQSDPHALDAAAILSPNGHGDHPRTTITLVSGGSSANVCVSALGARDRVTVRPLSSPTNLPLRGAAITSSGRVCMLLDHTALINLAHQSTGHQPNSSTHPLREAA